MTILIMQPISEPAIDWLRDQNADLVFGYEGDGWRDRADEIRAMIFYTTRIDRELLDALPALEVIGKRGAGIDTVDTSAVTERGIKLTNAGVGGNASSVAEHAVTLLLAATRFIPARDALVRQGEFRQRFDLKLVREVAKTRLGILGGGHIGRLVAELLSGGFGCKVGVHDPYLDPSVAKEFADVSFETVAQLLEWSDNVVIAAPLTTETSSMIGLQELRLLGPDGVLVVASRGGIVDEDALVTALRDGVICAAGIDAFDGEPPRDDHPLFELDNAVLTPHVAGGSAESRERTSLVVVQQVWTLLNGGDAPLVSDQPWFDKNLARP